MIDVSVPGPLQGVVETMRFGRRAGEWELELGPTEVPVSELVRAFMDAFDWATIRELDVKDEAVFHATLDLAFFWGEDAQEAVLPDAGKLWFERETEGLTLAVWPNLFTDRLPLYERTGSHSFASRPVEWPLAARRNRERLKASLRAWETATRGELDAWSSELVEGVERYGFAPTATYPGR